jgi:hypothetical protein
MQVTYGSLLALAKICTRTSDTVAVVLALALAGHGTLNGKLELRLELQLQGPATASNFERQVTCK